MPAMRNLFPTKHGRVGPALAPGVLLALLAAACAPAFASPGRLSAGGYHTCAATSPGPVYCWGWGQSGQLGDGGQTYSTGTPRAVPDSSDLIELEAGGEHTCGLAADGHVECWGYDRWGQIGNGPAGSIGPTAVVGIDDAVEVAAGAQHSCALRENGSIKCWGHGYFHQLGTGQAQESDVPVDVTVVTGATAIAAGSDHNCAIVAGGAVRCWGRNHYGQLGTAAVADNPGVPGAVDVPGIANAIQIVAGERHTCALIEGGSVQCWGQDGYGQLGNAVGGDSASPVPAGIAGAVEISSGEYHVCVRHAAGTMSCWGYNNDGQLADGNSPNHAFVPVGTNGIDSASQIALGAFHSCAVVRTEPVNFKCWGTGNFGQLGDGMIGGVHSVYAPVYVTGGVFDGIFGGRAGRFEGP
jgi:alpha-tubulin suppressor-like RCC1 family protein